MNTVRGTLGARCRASFLLKPLRPSSTSKKEESRRQAVETSAAAATARRDTGGNNGQAQQSFMDLEDCLLK